MKIRNPWCFGILLCGLLCAMSVAQPAPSVVPGMPPPPPPAPRPAMDNTVLPDITFDGIPLDQALKQLEQKVPDFHSVIVSDPSSVPVDMPVLPALSAKNLSLGQFMDFLKAAFPGLEIQVIDGPNAPLYVIHVFPAQAAVPAPADVVKVYSLKEIVLSIAGANASEDATKKAMNDVLSLVQSAVEALGEKGQYAMSVHQPTMTLIFKGTPRMMETADQVMAALQPRPLVDQMAKYREDLSTLNGQLWGNQNLLKSQKSELQQDQEQLKAIDDLMKQVSQRPATQR